MQAGKAQVTSGISRLYRSVFVGLIVILLISTAFWVFRALDKKAVSVSMDGEHLADLTVPAGTVAEALTWAKITVDDADAVSPGLETPVRDGLEIHIRRAFPVQIQADGKTIAFHTPGGTVADVLKAAGVTVGDTDKVSPGPDTPIAVNALIRVVRVREEIVTRTQLIPFDIRRWEEPTLKAGESKLIRTGQEGKKEVTWRYVYEDDEVIKREKIQERILTEPTAQIIGVGTSPHIQTVMTAQGPRPYTKTLEVVATAYFPGPESTGKWADGFTATGLKAKKGIVAVDPKVIPLGTKLYVPGYGEGLAADVGGAIKGYRIDVLFETYDEAIEYGRRRVTVYVLADQG